MKACNLRRRHTSLEFFVATHVVHDEDIPYVDVVPGPVARGGHERAR